MGKPVDEQTRWRERGRVPVNGPALQQAREAKGWSREKLAAELGCSHRSVERYENDQRQPTPDTVDAVARLLEVPVSDLLDVRAETIPRFPRPRQ